MGPKLRTPDPAAQASLTELLPLAIVMFDDSDRVLSINREAATVLRQDPAAAIGQHVIDLLGQDAGRIVLLELLDELRRETALRRDATDGRSGSTVATLPRELDVRRPDGTALRADVVALAFSGGDRAFAIRPAPRQDGNGGQPDGMARDSLTGLPTREVLLEQLRAALGRLERHPGMVAVAFIDLDQMKAVNDSLGHHAGDLMLCDIAARLRATLRSGDTVARFGGDEFVVLLQDVASESEVDYIVHRLQGVIEQPLVSGGHRLEASASIGVAIASGGGSSAEELVREADAAMYDAKRSHRGPVRYDERLRHRAQERMRLEADLRQGLADGEVRAHFQPIVQLDGRVVGAEALARWVHPERGLITPAVFVPLAEETGLIHRLGDVMLHDACVAVSQWRTRPGFEQVYAAINLSARQIARPGIVRGFIQAMDTHGLTPDALLIEVTETVLISDADLAYSVLTEASAAGVRVALDDFGTGYSSLTHLRDFPVDVVKIDQSFVARMMGNPTDMAIVQALIELCGALGVLVCAEGVEHRGQADALAELACPLAQGELWSGAMPADAFGRLLDESAP